MGKYYHSVLMITALAAVLAVSGCCCCSLPVGSSSGNNNYGLPTGLPGSNTDDKQATPTQKGGSSLISDVSDLFNKDKMQWYEYRLTSTADGKSTIMTYKIEYFDDAYNGVPAKHTRVTQSGSGVGMTINLYYDKGDNHLLGGKYSMDVAGQSYEVDIEEDDSSYSQTDLMDGGGFKDLSGLSNLGVETITVNGKTYVCTKYTSGTYTIWHSPQAPMPVKMVWTGESGDSGTMTMELLGWG